MVQTGSAGPPLLSAHRGLYRGGGRGGGSCWLLGYENVQTRLWAKAYTYGASVGRTQPTHLARPGFAQGIVQGGGRPARLLKPKTGNLRTRSGEKHGGRVLCPTDTPAWIWGCPRTWDSGLPATPVLSPPSPGRETACGPVTRTPHLSGSPSTNPQGPKLPVSGSENGDASATWWQPDNTEVAVTVGTPRPAEGTVVRS